MEGKEKIVLADGTEIEIENGAVENCVQVMLPDLDGLKTLYEKFTEDNLENYKIQNADGLTCANHSNKYLKSTLVEQKENGFLISFNLADVNMVNKRLTALEEKTEVQEGALFDLGEAVSGLAEQGGLI